MADFQIPEKFANAIDILGSQKVLKLITTPGSDSPARATPKTTAKIHYTGTLLDGTKFDSSRDRGQPFETPVGVGRVIKGWDAVMPTMAKNERAEVLIAPDFAYGESGSPPTIPGNSHLIFDMEMLDWFGEDISGKDDKSLTKIILKMGASTNKAKKLSPEEAESSSDEEEEDDDNNDEGLGGGDNKNCPQENTSVKINIQKNQEKIKENFEYIIGEEALYPEDLSDSNPELIKTCVKSMKLGERAEFTQRNAATGVSTIYTVELLSFETPKSKWDMSIDEILSSNEVIKNRAAELFKQGHLAVALNKYKILTENLDSIPGSDEEASSKEEDWNKQKIAVWSNVGLISLKMGECKNALDACDEVLDLDEKNEKAHFRKAQSYQKMGETDDAIAWYQKVLEINQDNKAARSGMIQAKKLKKKLYEEEKKKYSKMFG